MKTRPFLPLLVLTLAFPLLAHEKNTGGPNGGRLLVSGEPHAEFLLLPDRTVQIVFVDEHGNPIAPSSRTVTVTTGQRLSPTRLTFRQNGNALVSEQPVPAGANLPVVVQIKASSEAPTITERFHLNLATCDECSRPEYACICDH